ncbi:hypothetical protein C7974DRAFT_407311 [Boeremia exigua]|uniref:uncharacterized protein n=1 Tax=Boeremia exigua TaxID=749465 RepID=UPI001E8D0555|nr:uncharacterized protein C7974DRAFT_407311 [Boeremia exigua]KAH6643580.1 hypothetical protein C7974DRAFT_407311 [Boeremia exigua]
MGLHKRLERILSHHEASIQTNWRQKSRSQRQKVLINAWPDIPSVHRPDIAVSMNGGLKHHGHEVKATFTWPYINLEDLLRPKALLIFLNARARHSPDKFAYFDLEMAPLFKLRKEFLDLRQDTFTMDFLGRNTCDEYGQLVEWASHEEQLESLRSGHTIHVDHGIQILTIQRGILRFLDKCVSQLVGDIEIPKKALDTSLEPTTLTDNTDGYSLLHIIAREAPYRLPTELDLNRLIALTSAQKLQAIEHAWGLREDPAYFADAVEQQRDHRNELIPDLAGKLHEHAGDFSLYNKALRHLIMDAHCMIFNWDHISNSLCRLRNLSTKYADIISVDSDLPTGLLYELIETRFFIESVSIDLITMTKTYFPASPPLRKHSYRGNPDDPNKRRISVMPRYSDYKKYDDTLGYLLRLIEMFKERGPRDLFTLHVIMDEFERFMQSGAQAKALISPFMANLLSQLAILTECLHHLHCFQPWARKVENEIEKNYRVLSDRYDALLIHWARIDLAHRSFEKPELCKLGSPRDGKFDYPVLEKRTRASVEKMRSAEAALDRFWEAANAHWLRMAGNTPGALIKDIVGQRTLYRTPIWVEPPPKLPKSVKGALDGIAPPAPFSGHVHDSSKEFTGTFTKPSVPAKTKHRKKNLEVQANLPEQATATPVPEPSAVHAVDKRALKVFRTLFHSPDSPDQPGGIIWTDFLHAMVSVGFGAEKLQGSAWHFTPTALGAERSIQFHEPHPGNKRPFMWARRYGRRLTRTFGWTAGTFELA